MLLRKLPQIPTISSTNLTISVSRYSAFSCVTINNPSVNKLNKLQTVLFVY